MGDGVAKARYRGLVALLDGVVWKGERALFLSLAGPREAVRGIMAALAKGKEVGVSLEGEELYLRAEGGRIRGTPIPGGYHGIWTDGRIGEEAYVAREENPRREALWASRRVGRPIPLGWWPHLRPRLLLPAWGAVALRAPRLEEWEELRKGMTGEGGWKASPEG